MLHEIKNKIERELLYYARLNIKQFYSLSRLSPLLYKHIKEFIICPGKRARPILFIIAYLGFAKKQSKGLYKSAVALELFHDYMLIHDDIIDKSETRRGKLSMHAALDKWLNRYKNSKISGQDLAIAAGDVMHSLAIDVFLSVKENIRRKEMALKKLLRSGVNTASGEFIELLYSLKSINKITKDDIYKVYDLKTANYTFASPLSIGATLAGAKKRDINNLFNYGTYLGRAFQIKDDILGIFGKEGETGKSNLTDLREGKKTILIWQAYRSSNRKNKLVIEKILVKKNIIRKDLKRIQKIIKLSGALSFAKKEVAKLISGAQKYLKNSSMRPEYKNLLNKYAQELLNLL
jgi:geranylgeranyl diphosphate synthase type I